MNKCPRISTDLALALNIVVAAELNGTDNTRGNHVQGLSTPGHATGLTHSQVTLCMCIAQVFITHMYPISCLPPIF